MTVHSDCGDKQIKVYTSRKCFFGPGFEQHSQKTKHRKSICLVIKTTFTFFSWKNSSFTYIIWMFSPNFSVVLDKLRAVMAIRAFKRCPRNLRSLLCHQDGLNECFGSQFYDEKQVCVCTKNRVFSCFQRYEQFIRTDAAKYEEIS